MNSETIKAAMIEAWQKDIEIALNICPQDDLAASLIMQWLCDNHSVVFTDGGCHIWIALLAGKWRAKTPDVMEQAAQIARAIELRCKPIVTAPSA